MWIAPAVAVATGVFLVIMQTRRNCPRRCRFWSVWLVGAVDRVVDQPAHRIAGTGV